MDSLERIQQKRSLALALLPVCSKDIIPIAIKNADKLNEIESNLTLHNTLEAAPIKMQVTAYGRAEVCTALDVLVCKLAVAMNVKHNIQEHQVATIVTDLVEEFPGETFEDFMLLFKRMRKGYYGPSYHQLSEATIFECMRKHLEEKWALKEQLLREEKEHRSMDYENQSLPTTQQVQDAYKKIAEQGFQRQAHAARKKETDYEEFKNEYLEKRKQQQNGNQTQGRTKTPRRGNTDTPDTLNQSPSA